jgi:hypothetical protein
MDGWTQKRARDRAEGGRAWEQAKSEAKESHGQQCLQFVLLIAMCVKDNMRAAGRKLRLNMRAAGRKLRQDVDGARRMACERSPTSCL